METGIYIKTFNPKRVESSKNLTGMVQLNYFNSILAGLLGLDIFLTIG